MKNVSFDPLCKLSHLINGFSAYHDQNSSTPTVRIIVEDHFFYILSNRKKAAASYVKLVQKQVELLVSEIGVDAFLHLFSYEINEEHFNDHKWRATATLCNDQVIFYSQNSLFKKLQL